jgi:hypothetical protein
MSKARQNLRKRINGLDKRIDAFPRPHDERALRATRSRLFDRLDLSRLRALGGEK